MTSQPVQQKYTIDDLLAMPDDGKHYELIDGEIVEMGTSSQKHSALAAWLVWMIFSYIKANNLGGRLNGPDGTYRLDDANLRVPDVSYITPENDAKIPPGTVFAPFAPDFVIEIKSPSQSAGQMRRLARQYLNAGVRLVWTIDFEDESVLVYRPDQLPVQIAEEGVLDAGDVLSGLEIRLTEMFQAIARY